MKSTTLTMLTFVMVGALTSASLAQDQGQDIYVRKVKNGFGGYHLDVTIKTDAITINKITANRGNCIVHDKSIARNANSTDRLKLPVTLHFGDTLFFWAGDPVDSPCNPVEVSFDTDKGPVTFSWNE